MKIGASTVTAIFLGTTAITSAYLGSTQVFGGAEFSPSSLFAASEPGVWYDPSDLTTLFTDTAGTTPVTTPGQTVARMNDKSGRGNNATQATAASRPTYGVVPLGGRRNLLTQTNDLTNLTNWPTGDILLGSRIGAGVSVTDVEGYAYIAKGLTSFSYTNGTTYTFSATVVCDQTIANAPIRFAGGFGANAAALVNLQAGVSQRISITATATSSAAASPQFGIDARNVVVPGGSNATGYVVTFSDPQIETGTTATEYQRVTTAFDVTEAGVQSLSYLSFVGVDDSMLTGTITPGVD